MPTIPIETPRRVATAPSAELMSTAGFSGGADILLRQAQATTQDMLGVLSARGLAVQAEQDQQARLRVSELQNAIAEMELRVAETTGDADEYAEQVREQSAELFSQAAEGLPPEQLKRLNGEFRVLQSATEFNITKRELAKRTDSSRAKLMQTERGALAVFSSGTAPPQERELAQANYFGAIDDAVGSGVYTAVEGEELKNSFLVTGGKASSEAMQAAEVGFFADQLFNSGLSPTGALAKIEGLGLEPDTAQKLRDELEDRFAKDKQFRRNASMDYAGDLGARILANPLEFSEKEILADSSLDPQDRKTMVSLYQEARDKSAVEKDDQAVLAAAVELSARDPQAFIAMNYLAEKRLSLKTRGTLRVWQDHVRQQGELPKDGKLTVQGFEIARGIAKTRGLSDKTPGLKVNFETAYATAYAQKAKDEAEPKTKVEQAQLADEILAKIPQVNRGAFNIDWLSPDSEVPFFRLNEEGLNKMIDEAPIADWPQHIGDAAVMQLYRDKVREGMTPERAWVEVDRLRRTNERAMRAAARAAAYPAPRLPFVEDEEVAE